MLLGLGRLKRRAVRACVSTAMPPVQIAVGDEVWLRAERGGAPVVHGDAGRQPAAGARAELEGFYLRSGKAVKDRGERGLGHNRHPISSQATSFSFTMRGRAEAALEPGARSAMTSGMVASITRPIERIS